MTTTCSSTSTNPHIDALEAFFNDATRPIEWLVIAHNDPLMIQSLTAALSGQQAAVLELSQDTWDFAARDLPELLEWALQQGEIRNVVLAGHSQPGGAKSRGSLISPQAKKKPEGGYARLIAGVKRHNDRNRDVQQRFAAHVEQLSQIPVVHNRWSNGELAVHGLFYRAESGIFLAYDADADAFRPLVS